MDDPVIYPELEAAIERAHAQPLPPELASIEHPELQDAAREVVEMLEGIEPEFERTARPLLSLLKFRETGLELAELSEKYGVSEDFISTAVGVTDMGAHQLALIDNDFVEVSTNDLLRVSSRTPCASVLSIHCGSLDVDRTAVRETTKLRRVLNHLFDLTEAEIAETSVLLTDFLSDNSELFKAMPDVAKELQDLCALESLTPEQSDAFARAVNALPSAIELDNIYLKGLLAITGHINKTSLLSRSLEDTVVYRSDIKPGQQSLVYTLRMLDNARIILQQCPANSQKFRQTMKFMLGIEDEPHSNIFNPDLEALLASLAAMSGFAEARQRLEPIWSVESGFSGVHSILQDILGRQVGQLDEVRGIMYGAIKALVDETEGEVATDADLVQQVFCFEDFTIGRIQRLLEPYFGIPSKAMYKLLEARTLRAWRETYDEARARTELELIDKFCDEKMQAVAEIDAPYTYTSNRIRAVADGPKTVREVDDELRARGLHIGDNQLSQTLGLLIAQSKKAEDPIKYFEKLEEDREAIEQLLADIRFVGQERNSNLTGALNWIDEVIDAGEDDKIKHAGLKKFIESYFVGPEPEEEEIPIVDEEPVEEVFEQIEEPEIVSDVEPEEPIVAEPELIATEVIPEPTPELVSPEAEEISAQREVRRAQLRSRFSTLKEYADELEGLFDEGLIELSDVTVFEASEGPKSIIERRNNRRPSDGFVSTDIRRLYGLLQIKLNLEDRGMVAQVNVTQPTKKNRIPYLALSVRRSEDDETGVVILEHPTHNHATYTADVDGGALQTWEDVSALSRKEILDFGGASTRHPNAASEFFMHHYDVLEADILRRIREQNQQ